MDAARTLPKGRVLDFPPTGGYHSAPSNGTEVQYVHGRSTYQASRGARRTAGTARPVSQRHGSVVHSNHTVTAADGTAVTWAALHVGVTAAAERMAQEQVSIGASPPARRRSRRLVRCGQHIREVFKAHRARSVRVVRGCLPDTSGKGCAALTPRMAPGSSDFFRAITILIVTRGHRRGGHSGGVLGGVLGGRGGEGYRRGLRGDK